MAFFERISKFFISETGKKVSFYTAGTLSTSVLLAGYLPHTFLIDQYEKFVHLYKKGFAVKLPPKLEDRFQKALDLAQIHEAEKYLYKPFAAYGFDILSAGTSASSYGVIVGLPANFTYENTATIDKSVIKINNESVIWDTDEAKSLLESLIVSENAQLYAMVREIKFRETPKVFIDAFAATLSCMGAYSMGSSINKKLNFYNKPFAVRGILYCFISVLMLSVYLTIKDLTQLHYEEKIDKELKQNPILAEGGKEFYGKILQRNIALRKLLGKDGESVYTVLGNEMYFIRQQHLPLVQRKKFFENSGAEQANIL